jgi:hypothetical protein
MPRDFLECAGQKGSRVRTRRVNAAQYVRVCYPRKGGKAVSGEVRTRRGK